MNELDDDIYEVAMEKARICFDLPVYVGVWVLNIAKLIMLRFVYDVLDLWLPREKYELLFMDTDSIYVALAENTFREAILPEFLPEFLQQTEGSCHLEKIEAGEFVFPRTCCQKHKLYDRRQPGLQNLEYVANSPSSSFIGLASKTYVCRSDVDSVKFTCKGLQKDKVRVGAYERYERVLGDKRPDGARNVGFRPRLNTIWTYAQFRRGLPYFYCKRQVADDGVHTKPLSIVLNPWK